MAAKPPRRRLLATLALAILMPACASSDAPPSRSPAADPFPPGGSVPADDRPVLDLSAAREAPPPPDPLEPRGLVPPGEDPVLATVDGAPVTAGEVARFLFRYDPARGLDLLGQILDGRILQADAAAEGVTLPAGEVEARTLEQVRRQESDIRVQYGTGITLDRYLSDRFGISAEAYRRDLAALVRLQALRDRLVRLEALREERIRIRVLVLRDEAMARDAARRLREGADFTALAKQVSLAPADDLPSYRREEVQPPELAAELFAMQPGDISRPVRVAREGQEIFEVFKVVEHQPARAAAWPAVAEEVERGLKVRPVGPAEYLQWARRARERHATRILLVEPPAAEKR